MHRTTKAAFAAALCTLVAAPAAANAATKTVDMGLPTSAQKSFQKNFVDVNDFFPHSISVNVGDRIRFRPVGFHTVDLLPRGAAGLPLVAPQGKVAGATDAAGNPFWFNGQDQVGFNPVLVAKPIFGKSATFSGAKRVESGLPIANKPKPFNVRFLKAGTYTYVCDVHPGMKGTIKVLPRTRKVPSAVSDAAAVKRQIAASARAAARLQKTTTSSNIVQVGASNTHGVEVFKFFPAQVTVPVGTALTFRMSGASFEDHTATTGPGNPESEPSSYLGQLAASLQSPSFNPAVIYPSDAPPTVASLTPTSHGNGFWNSGFMDAVSGTPIPNSNSVAFTAPGTYQFYCLIHPFMHATVTVQ